MSGMNENNRWNVASEMQGRSDITTGEASTQSQRWISLLGEPSRESKPSRYGRVARVNNQLPDEYVGENLFLARELEGLTNNMGNVFTTEIYPMVTSDHVGRIEMTTWEFNRGIMHQEPWEGVPHLFTTKRKTRFVTVHRKGGGLKFEGDDLMTAKGREEYELKFMGVASVMIETYSMDTLVAIFRAIRTFRRENREHRASRLTVKRRIHEERRRFAAMNRNPEAFNKIITEVRQMLVKRGVAGPFYILAPPGTINSLRLDSFPDAQQRLDRQYAADNGQGALDRTSDIQRLNLGNGITIVEVPEILVETPGIPTQPLSRNVITGSFYMIALPKHLFNVNMFGTPYFSLSRAIRVWNTDGGYSVLTLRDALENAQFPHMDSVIKVLNDGPKVGGRNERDKWEKRDFDPSLDKSNDRGRHKHIRSARRAHMMIFWDKNHSALPVRFFGQMDQNILPFSVIRRMAECVAKNTGITEAKYMKVHKLLIRLARAAGDNQWFKNLADMNIEFSKAGGTFEGESTHDGAADIIGHRSIPNLREWMPQTYGGLLLPPPTVVNGISMTVPPGQCSYPGIRAIGSLPTNYGYADGLVEDCIEADNILANIEAGLSGGLASLVADAKQRSEWFHDPNARTTIVQTLFSGPKDALFLGAPVVGGGATDQSFDVPAGKRGEAIYPRDQTGGTYPDSDNRTILGRKMGTVSSISFGTLTSLVGGTVFTNDLWTEFAGSLSADVVDKDTARRMIVGLATAVAGKLTPAAQKDEAKRIIDILLGGSKRRTHAKSAQTEATRIVKKGKTILDKSKKDGSPDEDRPIQARRLAAGAATDIGPSERVGAYYRAPLTMSVGLVPMFRARLPGNKRFWVLPADPRSGHAKPLSAATGSIPLIPSEFAKRPSYRDPETHMIGDSIWHTTHLETSLNSSQGDEEMDDGEGQYEKAFGDIYTSMGGVEGAQDEYSDDDEGEGLGQKTDEVIGAMMFAADRGGRYSKDAQAAWALDEGDREKDLGRGGGYVLPFGGAIPLADGYFPPITDDEEPDSYGRIAAQLSVTNIAYNLRMTKRIASPFIRAMAIAIILSRCDKPEYWIALEDSSILTPCAAIIQRPALEQVLASMVMLKPGPETGVNIFGNLSTWVGGHTATKTVLVHITHTAATFTKQPKNIAAIANVSAQGVVSGGGDRWITSIDELSTENPDLRGDILPVIVPITEGQMPEFLSVLGYMNKVATDVGAERSAAEVNPQFSSIQYLVHRLKSNDDEYYSLEELYNPNEGQDEHDDLVADMSSLPMILLRDEWVESDGTLVASRAHRSTSTQGNGAEEVWNGMSTYFKTIYDKPTNALVHAY